MKRAMFILYVADQQRSRDFYRAVLAVEPSLDVPGMTEFPLLEGSTLGLMPEQGIKNLLGDSLPNPTAANGTPRAELYLVIDNAASYHQRALEGGGQEVNPMAERPWGDRVGYSLDPDGHVLAFAEPVQGS